MGKNVCKRGGMKRAFSMVSFSFFVLICPLVLFAQVEDTTPPTIQSLDFTPQTVDVSTGSQSITVTTRITDNLSGFSMGWFGFNSPSGMQGIGAWCDSWARIGGDSNDGLYQFEVNIPQFSEAGDWRMPYSQIYDSTGNFGNYSGDYLAAQGFPTILKVGENPIAVVEDLIADVDSSISGALQNSLVSKLRSVLDSLKKNNDIAAINKLKLFIEEVQAQKGKKIPADIADQWIALAKGIIAAVQAGAN